MSEGETIPTAFHASNESVLKRCDDRIGVVSDYP
jgi:hypothetical protein